MDHAPTRRPAYGLSTRAEQVKVRTGHEFDRVKIAAAVER